MGYDLGVKNNNPKTYFLQRFEIHNNIFGNVPCSKQYF